MHLSIIVLEISGPSHRSDFLVLLGSFVLDNEKAGS